MRPANAHDTDPEGPASEIFLNEDVRELWWNPQTVMLLPFFDWASNRFRLTAHDGAATAERPVNFFEKLRSKNGFGKRGNLN